jgi:predicted nucleic acid-binding protein
LAGVVVFDADVLIGFLGSEDAHHEEAVRRVAKARRPGIRRLLSVVNYAELLVGPFRAAGRSGVETVDAMLERLAIEKIPADDELSRMAGEVRAKRGLKLPDAFAVATAIVAGARGHESVRVESFDTRVLSAYASHSSAT